MVPLGYSRNVLHGTLPNGEIWQCGLWCNEAPSDQAATQSQADAFAADITSTMNNAGAPQKYWDPGTALTGLTVYSYNDATGRASFVGEHALSFAGLKASQTLPDQVSTCVSLETGHAGRRNRGRIYIPMTGVSPVTSGQLPAADCTSIANWWAALIGLWNGHLAGQSVVVLSQVAGSSNPVTSVRVDSRFDIQRRRSDRERIISTAAATV